jgi:hypothetical protein
MDRVNSICAVPLALIGNLESMQRWRWPAGTCMLTGLGPAWTRHIGGQRPLNGSKMSPTQLPSYIRGRPVLTPSSF